MQFPLTQEGRLFKQILAKGPIQKDSLKRICFQKSSATFWKEGNPASNSSTALHTQNSFNLSLCGLKIYKVQSPRSDKLFNMCLPRGHEMAALQSISLWSTESRQRGRRVPPLGIKTGHFAQQPASSRWKEKLLNCLDCLILWHLQVWAFRLPCNGSDGLRMHTS